MPDAELAAYWIQRITLAGPDRAIIDLFRGTGPVRVGQLIHDFHLSYRIDLVLVNETACDGGLVLTTLMDRGAGS